MCCVYKDLPKLSWVFFLFSSFSAKHTISQARTSDAILYNLWYGIPEEFLPLKWITHSSCEYNRVWMNARAFFFFSLPEKSIISFHLALKSPAEQLFFNRSNFGNQHPFVLTITRRFWSSFWWNRYFQWPLRLFSKCIKKNLKAVNSIDELRKFTTFCEQK